ncbi:hypothetical protein ACIQYM_26520, partial [Rhodococcus erythropolis]
GHGQDPENLLTGVSERCTGSRMNLTPQVSELLGVGVIYPGKVHNAFRNCSRKDRKDRYPLFVEDRF